MISKKWALKLSTYLLASSLVHATGNIGFVTDRTGGTISTFNLDNTSTPATIILSGINSPSCITTSPDGNTVYFTCNGIGSGFSDVYSFPAQGPYVATALGTGIVTPQGIAISADGTAGFVTTGIEIFVFPTSGSSPHTATFVAATVGGGILNPTFIAISGTTAYVAGSAGVSTFTISSNPSTQTSYTGQLAITGNSYGVNGLTVSHGNLYFSTSTLNTSPNQSIFQVPLSAIPTSSTNYIIQGIPTAWYGVAGSTDGKKLYAVGQTGSGNGLYLMPSTGTTTSPTFLSGLNIPNAYQLTIPPGSPSPIGPSAPSDLTGTQKKNDFGLRYELYNILYWQASNDSTVVGYNIYRDGESIGSVDASTLTYQDHNRKKGSSYTYSVTAFDSSGSESSPINTTIN